MEWKRGSLCKKSKILLEMEWKLTQNGVKFTQSYSILSKILFFLQIRAIPFFTPYFLQCNYKVNTGDQQRKAYI